MTWKCAGCGKPSPNRVQSCDCPTAVVSDGDKTAWKRPPNADEISERCHRLIGQFFEKPPKSMDAKDVDLIKAALKDYADAH